ncbi:calcium:proton antiporter [Sphingobacterium psychroaquaticum]|uniref:calcium:proton antiporter n=1 Tax=Sphingobacterium psychroaquaticum TaxID=561061 RepID=UPI00106B11FB|nr:calcium:proton antiporter [Sphingobacterium psychroaquaticum]QBQ40579.1 calcium:proton antiporter [Sphingobacterium psychroaquaticum]
MNNILTKSTLIRLVSVWLIVLVFMLFGHMLIGDNMTIPSAALGFTVLLGAIIAASFGVVKEADKLAHTSGEPYGTLILTLSIVLIEVILISAVMLGPGESPTIGKDSIFSVMMIIMNLVVGLCILFGGLRYGEQSYNAQGTLTYISMIVILGGLALLLPNFIVGAGGGMFTNTQAIVISVLTVVLYGFFLLFQMRSYKHLYIQPAPGEMTISFPKKAIIEQHAATTESTANSSEIWMRSIILVLMVLPIVLLSHSMATVVDFGITTANLPKALGGILIAVIVFTPESITAIKAAINNEFQRAINLCHGAFVSTVGLTVPAVLIIGILTNKTVLFGLTSTETLLFVLTSMLSLVSFLGKRTTPILGIIHLVLFAMFILLVFNP